MACDYLASILRDSYDEIQNLAYQSIDLDAV